MPKAEQTGGPSVSDTTDSDIKKVGEVARVGSLDLTVVNVDPAFNSRQYNQFNDVNIAIRIKATNARGDANREYSLSSFFGFKLVDSNGEAHDPAFACAGCPNEITSTSLVRGGSVEGNVYFKVPAGRQLVELRYQPLLSGNRVTISLR